MQEQHSRGSYLKNSGALLGVINSAINPPLSYSTDASQENVQIILSSTKSLRAQDCEPFSCCFNCFKPICLCKNRSVCHKKCSTCLQRFCPLSQNVFDDVNPGTLSIINSTVVTSIYPFYERIVVQPLWKMPVLICFILSKIDHFEKCRAFWEIHLNYASPSLKVTLKGQCKTLCRVWWDRKCVRVILPHLMVSHRRESALNKNCKSSGSDLSKCIESESDDVFHF